MPTRERKGEYAARLKEYFAQYKKESTTAPVIARRALPGLAPCSGHAPGVPAFTAESQSRRQPTRLACSRVLPWPPCLRALLARRPAAQCVAAPEL